VIFDSKDGIAMVYPKPTKVGHVVVAVRSHEPYLHNVAEEEASAMFGLANRIAKLIVDVTKAEKVYVLAIGDVDKHFHVHLIPKLTQNPSMGPYIFGQNGWAQAVSEEFHSARIKEFVSQMKRHLTAEKR
jgi:diadenosine tetraphosphate (Ap4A) HIT family hydrolase